MSEGLSEEEQKQIQKDIEETKNKLVSDETQKQVEEAKKAAKQEAQKEFELQKKLEELEKEKESLAQKLDESQKQSLAEIDALKSKVNEMVGRSRAMVRPDDPFEAPDKKPTSVENISDEEVRAIEEQSAEEFFGPDDYRHFKQQG